MKILPAIALALALLLTAHGAPPHSLTIGEGFVNPIGFHDATPVFSWKLPVGVERQTAYRIKTQVAGGASWDSGWVASDQSTFVRYGGALLVSRDRLTWQVNVRYQADQETGWSEQATCELGLLSAADWKGRWIRPAGEVDPKIEQVACLRRKFSIAKPIMRARLYATARGVFSLQLNGQRVGNDHFANGFTSYKKRIHTLTYNITNQLRSGDNTLEGLLGTGWYGGRFPFETPNIGPYGRDVALLTQVEVTYADGTTETVVSDKTWESTLDGPIISSSLYDGEVYDARIEPKNWMPVIAEAELGGAILEPKPSIPVRQTNTLSVQAISQPQPGRIIFDLGQNMVGWARLKIPVEKDKTVTVRFAEMLKGDGTLYTENYRTAKSTDTYTAAQTGIIEWEPHFTFHGFWACLEKVDTDLSDFDVI